MSAIPDDGPGLVTVAEVASVTKVNDMPTKGPKAASQRLRHTVLQNQSMWFKYLGSAIQSKVSGASIARC